LAGFVFDGGQKNPVRETSIIMRQSHQWLGYHPISRVKKGSGGEIINNLIISDAPYEKKGLESLAW